MSSNQRNWSVFLGVIGATGAAAIAYLLLAGPSEDNLQRTLIVTARLSLFLLLLVFVARPLRQLLPTPATMKLLRLRRLLGIAFAGVHTTHLGLILYRFNTVESFTFDLAERATGMLTYAVIYVMFATSFDATTRMLGPRNWRMLHKVGIYWLFIAFAQTQLPESLDHLPDVNWWLVSLIAAAIVIRLTAYLAKRSR